MRNVLAFLAACVITFAAVGWYLDWYSIRRGPAASAGQRSVTVDFNTDKIGEDLHSAEQQVSQKIQERARRKAEEAAHTPNANTIVGDSGN